MYKLFLSCLLSLLLAGTVIAQPQPLPQAFDKTKVLDYFEEQRFEEAISYLQTVIGSDSVNTQALRLLGYAYYMNEDITRARQSYLKLFELEPDNITANHYLANIYYNRDPDLAMGFFARLVRLQPKAAQYHRGLGELLSRSKQKDSALVFLNQAYALAPADYKNLVALAEVLIDIKNYTRADSLLELGLARDSLNAAILKARIRSAYEAKDYNSVLLPGERLMRIYEVNLGALSKVILAYYNLQQYENCIRVCEYMASMDIQVEAIYYYEAKARAKLKDYEKSNALLELCLDKAISKNSEMYYFSLGENYEAIKQYKKAVAAYDTAFYMFKSPLALYNCGRIYEAELKNETLARRYYTQYLALAQPADPAEKKAYAYVKERWGRKKPKK